ncbi:MAG: hypothetical protein ACEQSC_00265 [Candidatus Nanopelagicaceae bacterium]
MANEAQAETLRLIFEELVKIRKAVCASPDAIAKVKIGDFFNEYGDLLVNASIEEDGSPEPDESASSIALSNTIYQSVIVALKQYSDTGADLQWTEVPKPGD